MSQGAKSTYKDYVAKHSSTLRNDLLQNPETWFQQLALERALFSALRKVRVKKREDKVLDVGCGSGLSLLYLIKVGFLPANLTGIDYLKDRIDIAQTLLPSAHWVHGDAQSMPFESEAFDLTMESAIFIQIVDEAVARRIADEMLRTTKSGGHLVLLDWRYSKPFDPSYKGLSQRRIEDLFSVGQKSLKVTRTPGALVPPVGRKLSRWAPALYFLIQTVFPFLVGQEVTVLQKK